MNEPELRRILRRESKPLEKWQEAYDSDWGKSPMFVIFTKTDKPIGWLRVYGIDRETSEAWLTYFAIDTRYWGQGFGSDALKTILNTFLEDQGVNKVFLETFPDNCRAIGCYLKCGFKEAGRVWRGEGKERHEMLRMKWERESLKI